MIQNLEIELTKYEEIARIAYEVNRGYCESIGEILPTWIKSDWIVKAACIRGVELMSEYPYESPERIHNTQVFDKRIAGWVLGEEYDPTASPATDPNLVKWEDLSTTERSKNYIYTSLVRELLGA